MLNFQSRLTAQIGRVNIMKYISAFIIWNIPHELIQYIQPGQWIFEGDNSKNGIYEWIL